MVAEVCDASALAQRATEIAREMTQGPAVTYARAKRVARARATTDLDTALQASLAANIELIALAEVRDRIVNVMERYSASEHQRKGDADLTPNGLQRAFALTPLSALGITTELVPADASR